MTDLIDKGLNLVNSSRKTLVDEISSSMSVISEMVNRLPVFFSCERTGTFSEIEYDEKHYFIIPYRLSEIGLVLHTMRCLPDSVPELNDLPKRRVFHFAKEVDEISIRNHLINEAKDYVVSTNREKISSLEALANDIDSLDKKLTYGMLCIGGLAAVINPVVGIGIAAKAVLPGIGGLLSKYTLRPVGEKMTESQLKSDIKAAEDKIINDFESADTIKVINPVLQELELALKTSQVQHDPLLDFDLGQLDIAEIDGDRWRELTVAALRHSYQKILNDHSQYQQAGLGPEDVRWLDLLIKQY